VRERLVFAVIVGLLALGAVGAVVAPPGTSSAVKRFDLRFKLVSSSAQAARGGVAISGDGDTVLVGGDVFVRSGATWTRQAILSPVGATDFGFGVSVALSANGNTALIGDPYPQSSHGGTPSPPGVTTPAAPSAPPPSPPGQAFVFVRVGSSWTQQGPALVPGDAVGHPGFADAVALSADGRTVLIGGPGDNCCVPVPGTRFAREVGAAWVFTRVGSGWVQQGLKLTPPDAQSPDRFGARVSLSANGDTALIGSYRGNIGFDVEVSAGADAGAVWV